jgi:MoaA/NifB/PqqE/SkfB family radical SAM enzyme
MSEFITGYKAELIRLRVLLQIAMVAVSYSKNPVKGLKILAGIKAKRQSFQGLQRITKFIRSGGRYFFSDNVPGFPSPAFKGFIRTEVIRASGNNSTRIPFSTVFFSVTSKCPLRCPHCYEWENLSRKEYLSYDDLLVILNKIKLYGNYHFQLCGGEPLERLDELLLLIRQASIGSDVWINTSGFGLTGEVAHSLKMAGLTGVEVSLDHWDEAEHNSFRRHPESFYWVREAVESCNKEGLLTTLSLCATGKFISRENLDKYLQLAMSWGIGVIRILEPRETGRFRGEDIFLLHGQTDLLEEYYRDAVSSGKPREYPFITYPAYHSRKTGCTGGGRRYIYIDPKGDIHACPFCRRPAGNAVTGSIEDAVAVLRAHGCKEYGHHSEL